MTLDGCCTNCKYRYDLKLADYSKGGCKNSDVDNGFICLCLGDERIAYFMIGLDANTGFCEMYERLDSTKGGARSDKK